MPWIREGIDVGDSSTLRFAPIELADDMKFEPDREAMYSPDGHALYRAEGTMLHPTTGERLNAYMICVATRSGNLRIDSPRGVADVTEG